jgi:hypothetical protein
LDFAAIVATTADSLIASETPRGLVLWPDAFQPPLRIHFAAVPQEGERLAVYDGCSYLLPTIVLCDSAESALANREFLFPFVSVVDVTTDEMAAMPQCLGPTLVVTALTNDQPLVDRLLGSPLVGRLNLGAIQTNTIAWDQPHEGNLFDHLYGRRAFQRAG